MSKRQLDRMLANRLNKRLPMGRARYPGDPDAPQFSELDAPTGSRAPSRYSDPADACVRQEPQYGSLREKIAAESAARRERYALYRQAYDSAWEEGVKAAKACTPTPMIVGTPTTLLGNDIDYSKPTYYVDDGVCGFAWVTVKPGNGAFARWLVKNKLASKAYYGGVEIWIGEYGQSMARKEAHARAMASKLTEMLGDDVRIYPGSRMD